MPATLAALPTIRWIATSQLRPSSFSLSLYGDPDTETDGLLPSVEAQGILVPLVVAPQAEGPGWEVLSGHRRLACAVVLGHAEVPCQVRSVPPGELRRRAVLEYNRQRRKTFRQLMREADALEELLSGEARGRQRANLRQHRSRAEGRNSDSRAGGERRGRTDVTIARLLGFGGKDVYREARAVWAVAQGGDARAEAALDQLDAGTRSIHAAYKDLRRRDRFSAGFRPTPYDVWSFRHDKAFGIAHPGAIPPAIVAHALHYFTSPGALVVDPMAGGGTTLDVCAAMGRCCLAYDLNPVRSDVRPHDVRMGFPREAAGCDLVFADPPYHTMCAGRWPGEANQPLPDGLGSAPLATWLTFLSQFARSAFTVLKPGGFLALLLANQTEKDLPAGHGYLDHAFFGYQAAIAAGFLPHRRISCPMAGSSLPQQISRARAEGRMVGQVRDLLVMRRPS